MAKIEKKSQTQTVLNHLRKGNRISTLQAFKKWNFCHLNRLIGFLREDGYIINGTVHRNKKDRKIWWIVYSMLNPKQAPKKNAKYI